MPRTKYYQGRQPRSDHLVRQDKLSKVTNDEIDKELQRMRGTRITATDIAREAEGWDIETQGILKHPLVVPAKEPWRDDK